MHGADCYESGEGLTKNRRKNESQGNVNMYVVLKVQKPLFLLSSVGRACGC